MVRFVDRPYLTEKVTGKISSIKWKMACGIGMVGYHFITLSDNDKDIFDIYPAAVFKQKHFRKSDRIIIGVADSIDSARELTGNMINAGTWMMYADFTRNSSGNIFNACCIFDNP